MSHHYHPHHATASEKTADDILNGGIPAGQMNVISSEKAAPLNEADMLLNQPFDIVSDDEIRNTEDTPIEPLVTNFEEMALADKEEELEDLTAAQTTNLVNAIHRDHLLNEIDAHAAAAPITAIDGLVSPSSLLSNDEYKHLQTPMPELNADGSAVPTGEMLQPGPMLDPEDQIAIMKFMQGEIKDGDLTEAQKEVVVNMLLRSGGFNTKPGQSTIEAASEFFSKMRKMSSQNPVLFGRRVHLKNRTSKTRDKKKAKKKR